MKSEEIDLGFNNIKPWLEKKLKDRGLSVNQFAYHTHYQISEKGVFHWYSDRWRPLPQKMKIVCETLSRLPIKRDDGSEIFEDVPWSEGMQQYKPRPRAWAAMKVNKPTPDRKQK